MTSIVSLLNKEPPTEPVYLQIALDLDQVEREKLNTIILPAELVNEGIKDLNLTLQDGIERSIIADINNGDTAIKARFSGSEGFMSARGKISVNVGIGVKEYKDMADYYSHIHPDYGVKRGEKVGIVKTGAPDGKIREMDYEKFIDGVEFIAAMPSTSDLYTFASRKREQFRSFSIISRERGLLFIPIGEESPTVEKLEDALSFYDTNRDDLENGLADLHSTNATEDEINQYKTKGRDFLLSSICEELNLAVFASQSPDSELYIRI